MFHGNGNGKEIEDILKARFEKVTRKYVVQKDKKVENSEKSQMQAEDKKEPKMIRENQNVIQEKLVLGYRLNSPNLIDDLYKMTVYSAILGGTASSKLFMNVREKHSLAYTVRSMYLKHKGIMLVTAGIEAEKEPKALEYIQKEIEDMRLGNITENELNEAKVNLVTMYKSCRDNQSSMINFQMGQRILGVVGDIETMIQKINEVKKEDVVEGANRLEKQLTYILTK